MQETWRRDADKLTFIVCRPSGSMIGDVNMFLHIADDSMPGQSVVDGELELMIVEKDERRKGHGKAALLAFLVYVISHQKDIVDEFLQSKTWSIAATAASGINDFIAKIGKDNIRSLSLFEDLGFKKVSDEPNYWGEYELRHHGLALDAVNEWMVEYKVDNWRETKYEYQEGG
jgi:GNAT superfamily N-acetyltransferase